MSPLAKALLGFAGVLGLTYLLGKGAGDDAKAGDLALVPARDVPDDAVPTDLRSRLAEIRTGADKDASLGLKVDSTTEDSILGRVVGLFRKDGSAKLSDEGLPMKIAKRLVVGLLKRGRDPTDAGNVLEKGSFT